MPEQREVVEVEFRLPSDGILKKHPVIVISNSDINETEEGFVAVMMTSSEKYKDDEYSFEVNDSMFTKGLGTSFSAVRLHLIGNFLDTDIIRNRHTGNQMKIESFKRMLIHINRIAFDFKVKFE